MSDKLSTIVRIFSHESWHKEHKASMVRLYAPIPGLEGWFNDFLNFMGAQAKPNSEVPKALFGMVSIAGFSYFPANTTLSFALDKNGKLRPSLFSAQKSLPDKPHFFISVPLKEIEKASENASISRLDSLMGILKACFGRSVAWNLEWQGIINFADDTTIHTSKVHELPHGVDYPFADWQWLNCFQQILEKLSSLPENDETKQRVFAAMQFVEKGSESPERFIALWTGIEILLRGKAHHLGNRIGKLYGISSSEANKYFLLSDIKSKRDDLVHHGKFPNLDKPVIRYLEFCLIEIARHELGLCCLKILEQARNNPQFDLSSLT